MTPYGVYCRNLRTEHGVSLKTLASAIGVTASYLSMLEHGSRGKPSNKIIFQISEFFNLDPDQFLELKKVAQVSSPSLKIPKNSDPNVYWVAHLFSKRANELSEKELSIIKLLLSDDKLKEVS